MLKTTSDLKLSWRTTSFCAPCGCAPHSQTVIPAHRGSRPHARLGGEAKSFDGLDFHPHQSPVYLAVISTSCSSLHIQHILVHALGHPRW